MRKPRQVRATPRAGAPGYLDLTAVSYVQWLFQSLCFRAISCGAVGRWTDSGSRGPFRWCPDSHRHLAGFEQAQLGEAALLGGSSGKACLNSGDTEAQLPAAPAPLPVLANDAPGSLQSARSLVSALSQRWGPPAFAGEVSPEVGVGSSEDRVGGQGRRGRNRPAGAVAERRAPCQ